MTEFLTRAVATALLKTCAKFIAGWVTDDSEVAEQFAAELAGSGAKWKWRKGPRLARRLRSIRRSLAPEFEVAHQRGHLNFEAMEEEVAATLEQNIDTDLFLEKNLDSKEIAEEIKERRPLPKGFSEDEEAFYDRLLSEVVRALASTAHQLKGFHAKSIEKILQRQDKLLERLNRGMPVLQTIRQTADQTLETVQVIAARPQEDADDFEREYLHAVVDTLDEMELFGIDPRIDATARRQQLTIAYLTLNLTNERGHDEAPVSFEKLLASMEPTRRNMLLMRGDAGSGKSTLLKWAAIQSALFLTELDRENSQASGYEAIAAKAIERRRADRSMALLGDMDTGDMPVTLWKSWVPFYIPLRKCTDGKFPKCAEFPAMVNASLRTPPPNWVESVLAAGRGCIMIDGVDEVPPVRRGGIYKAIENLLTLYGDMGNLFVVTSRPLMKDPIWIEGHGFQQTRLAPMSVTDRNQLIDLWHEAVAKQLRKQDRTKEANGLAEKAERLKHDLARHPMVAQVASNPLMCAMLCALCGQLDYKLPNSQYEIVEQLCKVLLHSREEHTPDFQVEEFPPAYRRLKHPQRKAIVARLAYDMVLGGLSAVPRQSLVTKAEDVLAGIQDTETGDAEIVADTLIERSGMFRKYVGDEIDFIHNTFKEFLASGRFIDEGKSKALAGKCLQAGYKNVCLFAAAAENAENFVDALLGAILELELSPPPRRAKKTRRKKRQRTGLEIHERNLLAIRMHEVVNVPDRKITKRVVALRKEMFPPGSMADAEALAALGDAVVDDLSPKSRYSVRQKVRCVRALRLIPTQRAGEVLRKYAKSATEQTLLAELIQAMNPLEIPEIFRRVTSNPPGHMHSWDNTWLPDSFRKQIIDLSPLAKRRDRMDIVSLDLWGSQITDAGLAHLASLTELQTLYLTGTRITDAGLAHFTSLTELQTLYLNRCKQVTDAGLAHFINLTELRTISLSTCMQITNFGLVHLANLTELQTLLLNFCEQITDAGLAHLANLTELQDLELGGTRITDAGLAHLEACTKLEALYTSGTQVTEAGRKRLFRAIRRKTGREIRQ